jgi:hypothetical protein
MLMLRSSSNSRRTAARNNREHTRRGGCDRAAAVLRAGCSKDAMQVGGGDSRYPRCVVPGIILTAARMCIDAGRVRTESVTAKKGGLLNKLPPGLIDVIRMR